MFKNMSIKELSLAIERIETQIAKTQDERELSDLQKQHTDATVELQRRVMCE